MTEQIYITEWEDIIGLTVSNIKAPDWDSAVFITFTNGSRAILRGERPHWQDETDINLEPADEGNHEEMLHAGWMTKEEYEAICEKERREEAQCIERDELRKLEHLKAKYESGDQ